MIKLLKYLKKKEWLYICFAIVFIVLQVWLDLKMPDYMNTITQIAQGNQLSSSTSASMSDIWINGGYMLLCALGSMACSIVTSFFVVRVAADYSARLREKLYTKVQGFSMDEINKFSTASLITRTTNDVQQVQMLITMGLQMIIKAPITAIWAITKIAGKQWQWSLAVGIDVAVLIVGLVVLLLLVAKKFKKLQKLTDDLNKSTRENLSGVRVIRAYNAEGIQEKKFDAVNEDFTNVNMYTNKVLAFINPLMSLVMNGISLAIYWIGAYIINAASLAEFSVLFADMVVFMSYGMQIISAFMMLAMMFMIAPRSLVSANRILEVLETKESIVDGPGVNETSETGTVEFRNVSFCYPDGQDNVLTNISFKANKGETVAFIGSTGCGKSSLIHLIPRFYDVNVGEILIDGENVKKYKKNELAKKIGYISQKAVLFSGDIESNINFGDNESDDSQVNKAIEIAKAKDFVEEENGGVNGSVSQGGTNFSGGQKQRLSIARALARKAEIYLFDDTFSALDYKTDRELRKNIKEEMKDATCLIVAQRIGTIMDADKIIVLEDGKIVGAGKHKELLETCPTYKEIAESQLSKEEL